MAASSLTWAGKKLTPTELINSLRTDPLPLVVKVTQVTNEYEKSCPQMATGTVHWIYGTAKEARVALKTTDRNAKYISIPCDAPIKFAVVHTHERGPPTLLSNMLKGKAQSDLRVEMAGNTGNRLSSTPDQAQSIPYGTLQVVGIYNETVLQAQTVVNVVGELNPLRRNISVNCPVSFDIATGIYGKSSEDFRKLKERLKQSQTSRASNQADTSFELVLLANPPKGPQDFSQLRHIYRLHSNTQADTASEEAKEKSGSRLGHALQQLRQSSKQEDIPLIDKAPSRKSMFGHKPNNTPTNEATYDDGSSNLHADNSWIKKPTDSKFDYVTIDAPTQGPSEYENEADRGVSRSKSSAVTTGPSVYLNESESANSLVVKEPATSVDTTFGSNWQSSTTHLPVMKEYERDARPDQMVNGTEATKVTDHVVSHQSLNSAPSHSIPSGFYENDAPVAYEEIPANKLDLNIATFGKQGTPLPPVPTRVLEPHKNILSPKQNGGGKRQSEVIPEIDSCDEGDYLDPDDEEDGWKKSPTEIPRLNDNRKWKTVSDIPKNVKEFSISDVSLCLELLRMHEFVAKFRDRNVDGKILQKLSKKMYMESFQMQEFEANQLYEFAVKKWRPKK